jgi:hypothetical protein
LKAEKESRFIIIVVVDFPKRFIYFVFDILQTTQLLTLVWSFVHVGDVIKEHVSICISTLAMRSLEMLCTPLLFKKEKVEGTRRDRTHR